jgi:chromosome segregation ATPase
MVDEEKDFYTWDEIEKDLSELELQYGDNDEIVKNLVTPSVSSYWRKKLEEEKLLHQKIVQTKEEEKKQIELKLAQQQQIIDELKSQIEKLEKGESEKLRQKYDELRLKELELVKEKEKLLWQQQLQGLEYDKKVVEQEIERAKQRFEQEKQELLVYYNRQFNSLLEVQKELIEETNKIEKDLENIVLSAKSEIDLAKNQVNKINSELEQTQQLLENLKIEKQTIILEKQKLTETIEQLKQQNLADKKQVKTVISQMINSYISEIRSLCGIIIGATNFCEKFSNSKKSVKFHHELILATVQRILSMLDEMVKSILEFEI